MHILTDGQTYGIYVGPEPTDGYLGSFRIDQSEIDHAYYVEAWSANDPVDVHHVEMPYRTQSEAWEAAVNYVRNVFGNRVFCRIKDCLTNKTKETEAIQAHMFTDITDGTTVCMGHANWFYPRNYRPVNQ